jgi:hypothetical protein
MLLGEQKGVQLSNHHCSAMAGASVILGFVELVLGVSNVFATVLL